MMASLSSVSLSRPRPLLSGRCPHFHEKGRLRVEQRGAGVYLLTAMRLTDHGVEGGGGRKCLETNLRKVTNILGKVIYI